MVSAQLTKTPDTSHLSNQTGMKLETCIWTVFQILLLTAYMVLGGVLFLAIESCPEKCSFTFQELMGWTIFCFEIISTVGYGTKELKTATAKMLLIPYSIFGIFFFFFNLYLLGLMLTLVISKGISSFERQILKRDQVRHKKWKILFLAIILTSTSSIVTAYIYSYISRVDIPTSIYYIYVTFSTIGFRHCNIFAASNQTLNVVMIPFVWCGLVSVSALVQALVDIFNQQVHIMDDIYLDNPVSHLSNPELDFYTPI